MKIIRTLFAMAAILASACSFAASHCRTGEMNYFSCSIQGSEKIVSLCGPSVRPENNFSESALVQYRFGKPRQIEITYPKKKSPAAEAFTGEYIVANDRRLYSLMFKVGAHKYEVLVAPGFQGVIVSSQGREVKFPCASYPHTEVNFLQLVKELSSVGANNNGG